MVGLDDTLEFRIFDAQIDIGGFYVVLVFLVLAGATNGVNLTDGLDGLAAGCGAIVLLTYTAMAFITGGQDGLSITEQDGLALLGACLVGASVGFLWFNSFPAAIFMGDTGSLGLGGAIAGHGGDDQVRGAADRDRRDLRDRGAVGGGAGAHLPRCSAAACC